MSIGASGRRKIDAESFLLFKRVMASDFFSENFFGLKNILKS